MTNKPAMPEPIGYADANNLLAASTDDAVPIIVWASGGAERGFAFDVPLYTQAAITAAVAEARTEIEELKSDIADALTTIALYEAEARAVPGEGWTDADADAARLALELECLLTDKDVPMPALSRWWDSAHEALRLHRERLAATPSPA